MLSVRDTKSEIVINGFETREIRYAFHDIDGTHSLIREWPPVMSICLYDVIENGLPEKNSCFVFSEFSTSHKKGNINVSEYSEKITDITMSIFLYAGFLFPSFSFICLILFFIENILCRFFRFR